MPRVKIQGPRPERHRPRRHDSRRRGSPPDRSPRHRSPRHRVIHLAALACLLAGTGFGTCTAVDPPEPTSPPAPIDPAVAAPGGRAATVAEEKRLAPELLPVAAPGAVPEELVVRFSTPAYALALRGKPAPRRTLLVLTPAVEGKLTVRDRQTLVFTPAKSFQPGTGYRAELVSVETSDGVLYPREPGAWAVEFETPPLELVRLERGAVDLPGDRVEVDMVFSAPVDAELVARRAAWWVDDGWMGYQHQTRRVSHYRTDQPHVVRAQLRSDRLKHDSVLRVRIPAQALAEGETADDDTPSTELSLPLELTPTATVLDVFVAEGATGHYVEVVCDDDAVHERRSFWAESGGHYHRVSRRCLPEEGEAERAITLDPPAPFRVSPSRGGFRILTDLARGPVTVTIATGLRTVDGSETRTEHRATLEVPARSARLSFAASGRYLPRSAWSRLPLRHLNVDEVELTVRRVPPRNLVYWMSEPSSESATRRTADVVARTALPVRGPDDVEATTWVSLAELVEPDAGARGLLEIAAQEIERDGAGKIRRRGVQHRVRLLRTDLQLVAKRAGVGGPGGAPPPVNAWAVHVETLAPQRGVALELVRESGKVVASCTTGPDGGCSLAPEADPLDSGHPFALIARKGDDLTYLKFDELEVPVAEGEVHGEPYRTVRPYRAALYGDRGAYRPGETAHVVAVVRDRDDVAPEAGLPVQIEVLDPTTKVFKRLPLSTDAAGVLAFDLGFSDVATTGRYRVVAKVAGAQVGEHVFHVEELVPERMRVRASAVGLAGEHDGFGPGAELPLAIEAEYLFGGVPAGARVELGCSLETATFRPREHAGFHYGLWRAPDDPARPLPLGTVEGTLDGTGRLELACPAPGPAPAPGSRRGYRGPSTAVARAAVFEAGSGRATVGTARVPVHPERWYVGLPSGARRVEAGTPFTVEGVLVDWNGAALATPAADPAAPSTASAPTTPTPPTEVEVELLRLDSEVSWTWDERTGRGSYRRLVRPVSEGTRTVPVVEGAFAAELTLARAADAVLVRATAGRARTELRLEGEGRYAWWSPEESRAGATPRPAGPTWIALDAPGRIRVGEDAELRFRSPFRGRALVTVETDRVLRSEWIDVDAGDVRWGFRLSEFAPNVYATALVIKDPHLDSDEAFLPDRAFGVRSVAVDPDRFRQGIRLVVPDEVRSRSRLRVELELGETEPGTVATVAAVDEGLLSLTGFRPPDPLSMLFSPRALGVETFETVGWTLLLPPADPGGAPGGGREGGRPARVQPVRPVALWSGLRRVPADGKLVVELDLPAYRGALTVMAVTAGPTRIGSASASVVVRDPLVVQATLPRFLTEGDVIRIPVQVTNLAGEADATKDAAGGPREIEVSIEATELPVPGYHDRRRQTGEARDEPPPVEIEGRPDATLRLAHGASGVVTFQARATRATGAARIAVIARSGEHESREQADLPLVPTGPRRRLVQRIPLEEGTTNVSAFLRGWVPTTERSTLWVTTNPYGEVLDHLKYLIRYPYGCIEQTVSSTRPLLYVGKLVSSIDPALLAQGSVEDRVQKGIERLLSMQLPSGGFGYWPGRTEPVLWGSAHATHLLLDARQAGYEVPPGRLESAVGFLESELANKIERALGDGRAVRWGRDSEAYMQYVVALGGRGRKARVRQLLERRPANDSLRGEEAERRFLLMAALHLAGDRTHEPELRRPDVSSLSTDRSNGWTFYSDRRRRGLMLNVLGDLFGPDPVAAPLAEMVAAALSTHPSRYYTTQELAWGITGLGKQLPGGRPSFEPPVLVGEGEVIEPEEPALVAARAPEAVAPAEGGDEPDDEAGPPVPSPERTWSLLRASEYESLELRLPRKEEGTLYLVLSSEGIRERATLALGGDGLALHRRWLRADGSELDPATDTLALGELVYVELELSNEGPEVVRNLALVDRFPAGWEIENPRLGRDAPVAWIDHDARWETESMNPRDDRFEVFGHLEAGRSRTIVYGLRAVTAGTFRIPTAEVEAMYDPRVWARAAGGTVRVVGP